ncbi:MAG TPA: histidine kinase [Rhizomicrobium sp.]|jgi:two-component system sensor histidine kinase AlgZ
MGNRARIVLIVIAAWVVIALAYTPPTIFIQQFQGSMVAPRPPWIIFVDVLCGFVPWMAMTPLLFWLGRRYPVSQAHAARAVAIHAAIGLIVLPATTLAGTTLGFLLTPAPPGLNPFDIRNIGGAALITAFYSVPTYVAVVAIGQALTYFERYRIRERMLARAELRALQAQIRPHFLFNTLNAIAALIYRDPKQADAAIAKLAEVLRATLKDRPQEIPLSEEIGFAKDYLALCEMLTPGPVRTSFTASPEAWNALVPSMLLQPLFENAIVHGLAKRKDGGALDFTARVAIDTLVLELRNDGADAPAESETGTGIGLSNVHERLAVLYGRYQSLELEDVDGGVIARVKLPYREAP